VFLASAKLMFGHMTFIDRLTFGPSFCDVGLGGQKECFRADISVAVIENGTYSEFMAWGFRKSINFGPLRINTSKSGLGYSFGGRGFRIGKDSRGRGYRSTSIPGTGIYNRTYTKKSAVSKPPRYTSPSQPNLNSSALSKVSGRSIVRVLVYLLASGLIYLGVSAIIHLL
jgi:hypothetical protein